MAVETPFDPIGGQPDSGHGRLGGYLARVIHAGRPLAVVASADGDRAAAASRDALAGIPGLRTAWVAGPVPTGRALLVAILAELGLDPPPAGLDELFHLLVVYLRHEARRGHRTAVGLRHADSCGPCVLDLLQTLARVPGSEPGSAAATFVLCGGPGLDRVLDSPGMAGMRPAARERFDLDRLQPWLARAPLFVAPAPPAATRPDRGGELTLLLDGIVGRRYALRPGRNSIGRDPGNDLAIASRYVSRRHAVIINGPGGDQLLDLRSANGTFVNGRPVGEHRLVDQDLIAIGNYRLRYRR